MARKKYIRRRIVKQQTFHEVLPTDYINQFMDFYAADEQRYKYVRFGICTDLKAEYDHRKQRDEICWSSMKVYFQTDRPKFAKKFIQQLSTNENYINNKIDFPETLFDEHPTYYLFMMVGRKRKSLKQIENDNKLMIQKGFKFIDLFCGIGGFHQAMTLIDPTAQCVFASDIDKECQKTYFENYGIMPEGDITKVKPEDIEPFNVLCAGFPCQAFSHAGKQLGFNDPTRGTLFFDVIRIAKHHMPEYMLLENVKNLAMHDNGHTWEVIYDTIQEAGYNVLKQPVIFSPHFIGLPQNRERVFIMCIRKDIGDVPEFQFDVKKKDLPPCDLQKILLDDDQIENIEKYRINQKQIDLIDLWDDLVKGVKCDMPGCPIYGEFLHDPTENEDTTGWADWKLDYLRKNNAFYLKHKEFIDGWFKRAEKVEMYQNTRRHLEWQTYRSENESMWNHIMQFRQSGLRVKRPTYFPALVAIVQTSILAMRKRYVVPRECARMQSFPDSFKMNSDDHIAYKQFGNSVNVKVVELFARYLFGDENVREKYSKK